MEQEQTELTVDVLSLLAQGKTKEATELLAKNVLENNHIYTTRDDKCSEVWIYREGIYVPQGKTYIKERCRKILYEAFTTYLCNQVIAKIEADTYIEQEEFFKEGDINLIAVENGILNLKTKTLGDFDPKYRFFSKLPVEYISNADCPAIKEFFKSIFPNEQEKKVIQEIFGFLLYKDYFLEKAFMFLGDGRNGKGKTLGLMKKFLGIENCAEIPLEDLEKDIFALCHLFKRMANLCGDLSTTALMHTGIFKKLVGRDMVEAPRKFKTRVKFINYAKAIFSCNELPITYDRTLAFFDRWIIIDFPYTFLPQTEIDATPEDERENIKLQDPNILNKISTKQEMSGLLNWALEGLDRLQKNGSFSFSPSTEEVKKTWMRKSDSCNAFIMDCIEQDFSGYVTKEHFKLEYSRYCAEHKLKVSNDRKIKAILTTVMGATDSYKKILVFGEPERIQQWCWVGIKLKDFQKTAVSDGSCKKELETNEWIQ